MSESDTVAGKTVQPRAATGLSRGAQLGRYVVLERLGAGGMGVVYTAYDPELDRKVAVKLLQPCSAEQRAEEEARLLREGQAMARLSHPNVITVHDVGTFFDQVFVAMEFVDGVTLREVQKQPLSWQSALKLYVQAGRGLAAAHAAGLIHRDFKPDNTLVDGAGRVRVLDFGLARALDGAPETPAAPAPDLPIPSGGVLSTPLTNPGAFMGTPQYMAPEQLFGAEVDARTDQFGFCVAFYEALYGERPFRAATLQELAQEIERGHVQPAPPGRDVPDWLRQALLRGLSTRPADRFPSMDALLAALDQDPDRDARHSDRARAVAVALVALLLAGLALYARLAHPQASTPPSDGELAIAGAGMALILGGIVFFGRKRLMASRISRQIVAALTIVFYGSLAMVWAGLRLQLPTTTIATLNVLWIGAYFLALGVVLQRLFYVIGALGVAAGVVAVLRPDFAGPATEAFRWGAMALLLWVWARRRR
jgi:predicted Ser/Thr protein kinase